MANSWKITAYSREQFRTTLIGGTCEFARMEGDDTKFEHGVYGDPACKMDGYSGVDLIIELWNPEMTELLRMTYDKQDLWEAPYFDGVEGDTRDYVYRISARTADKLCLDELAAKETTSECTTDDDAKELCGKTGDICDEGFCEWSSEEARKACQDADTGEAVGCSGGGKARGLMGRGVKHRPAQSVARSRYNCCTKDPNRLHGPERTAQTPLKRRSNRFSRALSTPPPPLFPRMCSVWIPALF